MGSSVLAPFFIIEGLDIARQVIDQLPDDQLCKQFGGLYHAQHIRRFYKIMHGMLNGDS